MALTITKKIPATVKGARARAKIRAMADSAVGKRKRTHKLIRSSKTKPLLSTASKAGRYEQLYSAMSPKALRSAANMFLKAGKIRGAKTAAARTAVVSQAREIAAKKKSGTKKSSKESIGGFMQRRNTSRR